MKSVRTGAQNHIDLVDVERPAPGPKDVLVRIRACGICGTDTFFLHLGGMPAGADGSMRSIPLGHEPAGEITEVGAEVTELKVGDRVVVNPQGVPSGIIGCGGEHGAMSEGGGPRVRRRHRRARLPPHRPAARAAHGRVVLAGRRNGP
ncbi:alcohol dehydrogenase catalytic domain-containing protein [Streptomyces sp. NRRL S-646]|uniref:alcohol dehydrogenase catalytic domain-containing protein n=1 Tax=Streptomyces sp. NRRL S-646 TaxID=1463917 RepID=UPI001F2B0343|nr:alcohol dehydrogenase catalytic domain-containing protein [Streptomyces sp. NRRL S-646]